MTDQHKTDETTHFQQCPRYHTTTLSEKQLEDIANDAARKAVELFRRQFYQGVGAAVINRTLWLLGAIVVAIASWLSAKGILK